MRTFSQPKASQSLYLQMIMVKPKSFSTILARFHEWVSTQLEALVLIMAENIIYYAITVFFSIIVLGVIWQTRYSYKYKKAIFILLITAALFFVTAYLPDF
jgi:uncharacterized membrane protein